NGELGGGRRGDVAVGRGRVRAPQSGGDCQRQYQLFDACSHYSPFAVFIMSPTLAALARGPNPFGNLLGASGPNLCLISLCKVPIRSVFTRHRSVSGSVRPF